MSKSSKSYQYYFSTPTAELANAAERATQTMLFNDAGMEIPAHIRPPVSKEPVDRKAAAAKAQATRKVNARAAFLALAAAEKSEA